MVVLQDEVTRLHPPVELVPDLEDNSSSPDKTDFMAVITEKAGSHMVRCEEVACLAQLKCHG